MATAIQESLNVVEHIAKTLKNTLVNLKKSPKARLTRNYVETRLNCVEDYWQKYQHAYEDIIRNAPTEKEVKIPYIEKNEFYEHEELYISLKSDLMDLLGPKEVTISAPLPTSSEYQQTRVMLPKIQLPTFSGQYEDWMSFHDLFNTLVHMNKSLSNVQKLHYLKTSIMGEAASALKNIQVTDSNYEIAWKTLKARYGNKRITINAVMRRFFSQKKITLNNSSNIKNLLDTTFECLHHLNNMKVNTENWDPIIIFVTVQKLDSETHKEWEDYVSSNCKDFESLPSLELLRKFLENRFRTLELTEPAKTKMTCAPIREKTFHVTTNHVTTNENNKICKMCNEQHTLSHCKVFDNQTPIQRSEFIKSNNLCFNCLAYGHSVRHCRIPTCCRICRRRHHTLLHETVEKNTTTPGYIKNTTTNQPEVEVHTKVKKIEEEEEEKEEDDVTMVASHISTKQNTALLATAIVQVRSEDNFKIPLRALIDQGSQASFISERAAQLLKAKRYPIKGTVVGVGSTKENIKQVVQVNLDSTCEDFSLEVRTYVMSTPLTTKLPSQTIKTSTWPHLDGLVLADPNYFKPGSIDLLLGVDVYAQIVQSSLIKGPPGSPCAHKTTLGWILFGKIEDTIQKPEPILVMHHQILAEDFVKTLWEVDRDTVRKYTKEEKQCEKFYEENHTRDSNGRYIVRLPFRTNEPVTPSGNSREIAMKRLNQQEKRLQQTPELRKEYNKVLEEYLEMGHMTEISEEEINNSSVYLPHHAVIRADKETTKVRVVFDASCKYNNGVSLNDELMTGPVLQEDMRSILMRWRMHKICFASDVIKMYRMILLDKRDTDYHRILWRRNNAGSEVKDYRLNTVTFGTASAPYLAVKTLMKLAEDEGKPYSEAAKIIREDFYVDDLISGCDSTEQAIDVSKQIIAILQRGGFELQKWASNDNNFLKCLDASKITTKANLDIKLDGIIKALGLSWNLGEDEFHYQLQLEPIVSTITKRTILSDLQKLFDPLGWIAPAIVTAKILVQRLWLEGVSWDQDISKELENEWKFIREDLTNVNEIKIKRWLNTISTEKKFVALHGFCDASEKAYAAVVYCRVKTKDKEIKTHLVAAKTKVAPVKTISLPRLELCGALLLSKLLYTVSQAMRIPAENVFAWTDSTIVLAWLLGEPNRWKPFVANRVVDILEHTNNSQWYHVQSSFNPADIASRGSSVSEIQHKTLWWNGPTWLMTDPIQFIRPHAIYTDIERKKTILSHVHVTEREEKCIKFEKYDSLSELLRVIVYCKKFLSIKRDRKKLDSGITAEEIQTALDICIRQVQGEEYSEEIRRLKEGKAVKGTSTLKTLNPFIDEQHILRVGGRLRNADVDDNLKHPVILNKRNGIVRLLIADAHLKTIHGGINLMITYLMSKYWIVGCKSLVKQYIRGCLTCARQRAASRNQIMGDLPEQRVTPSRAFSRSGVDFAGPVYVLNSKGRGAKTRKAYICIFICMAVKAMHLELVSDLTASAFIAAFKRFVARRGRCHEIWSDNGTNFVAANKELFDMWKKAEFAFPNCITEQLASDGTQWHFTPPYSPNFGGLWEAGVKSIKQHLRKILTSRLTFEEFATVLTQIEACLNSRPLTPIPTDMDVVDNIQVITPGHFLIGESLVTVPERSYETDNVNLLTRWQHMQRLVQTFWRRWHTEYLTRLNQRPKWLRNAPQFEVGDIVLVKGENMPPSKWPLARIIQKHPGHDDMTRVYKVRCNSKNIRRSISSLCALPINTRD